MCFTLRLHTSAAPPRVGLTQALGAEMNEVLEQAIADGDANAVQSAIFELGSHRSTEGLVPDEVAFYVIEVLRRDSMKASPLAGHILNFFEFEARCLSRRAKERCRAFLREWGKSFTHVHSQQVVTELLHGEYLST